MVYDRRRLKKSGEEAEGQEMGERRSYRIHANAALFMSGFLRAKSEFDSK